MLALMRQLQNLVLPPSRRQMSASGSSVTMPAAETAAVREEVLQLPLMDRIFEAYEGIGFGLAFKRRTHERLHWTLSRVADAKMVLDVGCSYLISREYAIIRAWTG